jgi:4-(gamma-glutamylamino)butanal dehydrogenase
MSLPLETPAIQDAMKQLRFPTKAFIDGRAVDAASGKTFPTENPANGKVLARIAECGAEDVERAVRAARASFEKGAWSRRAPAERKHVLLHFAELVERHAADLALLDTVEAGKPVVDTVGIDLPDTIHCIRWHAEAIDKLNDQVSPTAPSNVAMVVREPLGVVAAVLPWNFPVQMAAWKLGPILATGNSVVLKPAKLTSMSALRLAELAAEAGLPEGVLNVVPGPGTVIGETLGRHPDVDAVTFTGSTEVGRLFLRYASESNLKRVMLELGGKSPQIVFADADLDAAARHVVPAAYWNMGENCSANSRLIVHRSVHDAVVSRVKALLGEWRVGDPLDPAVRIGPMIEKSHMEKVLGYIETGRREGAELALGGRRVLAETGGWYIEPTIFVKADNRMKIAQEEIFGPVLTVIPFDTEAEAVAIANDTVYGLHASLHTKDVSVAHRVARALRAGTVSVNCYSEGDITTPFGGFKLSGFFGRDKSIFAHHQYTELKTVWIQIAP